MVVFVLPHEAKAAQGLFAFGRTRLDEVVTLQVQYADTRV